MNLHDKHIELVDAVNNSKTIAEHDRNYWFLAGWRAGQADAGYIVDLIAADLVQFERGFENRPMCCGVFSDWQPEKKD